MELDLLVSLVLSNFVEVLSQFPSVLLYVLPLLFSYFTVFSCRTSTVFCLLKTTPFLRVRCFLSLTTKIEKLVVGSGSRWKT